MNKPFLVMDTPHVRSVNEPGRAVTRVAVRGRWGGETRDEVSLVLRACVAEAPRLLLVDLTGIHDPDGASAPTWQTTTWYAAEARPPVGVVLCAASPQLQRRLSANRHGPATVLADTPEAALATLSRPEPTGDRQHLALPGHPRASALARTMAGDACLAFGVPSLRQPARLIVSELVSNAVQHTGSEPQLWISKRGTMLHLAVQDRSSALPRLLVVARGEPGTPRPPGLGLRLVAAASTAWGALPCRDGKAVWATLAIRPVPAG